MDVVPVLQIKPGTRPDIHTCIYPCTCEEIPGTEEIQTNKNLQNFKTVSQTKRSENNVKHTVIGHSSVTERVMMESLHPHTPPHNANNFEPYTLVIMG